MPPKVSVYGGAEAPIKHGLCLFVVQVKFYLDIDQKDAL